MRANMEFSKHAVIKLAEKVEQRKSYVKREVKEICELVANVLGNSGAMCKRAYVDPLIIEHYMAHWMTPTIK